VIGGVIRRLNEKLFFYGYPSDWLAVRQKVNYKKVHLAYSIFDETADIPEIERSLRHLARIQRSESSAGTIRFKVEIRQKSVPYIVFVPA